MKKWGISHGIFRAFAAENRLVDHRIMKKHSDSIKVDRLELNKMGGD